jgi:flavin-binding protein dodecin
MAEPFDDRTRATEGLASRLPGRKARAAAAREIEALLAQAPSVSSVSAGQVVDVAARNGLELDRRLRTPTRNLYRRYFEFCLLDQAVSDEEAAELDHLRTILALDDADAASVHDEVARTVYGAAVEEVLDDHRLDPDEAAFLQRLRDDLRLDESVAAETIEDHTLRSRQRYIAKVASTDDVLVTSQEIKLTLEGSSEHSLDDAVADALREACAAIPELASVEIASVRVDVDQGRIGRWRVSLRTVLDRD